MNKRRKKYLIRLDDACPTMDNKKWSKIEEVCDRFNIKPIVAVIPNNKSKFNENENYDPDFWKKVKTWQNKGWHIALHGYDHIYIDKPGKAIIPINKYSEFAGLPYEQQFDKIRKGLEIFHKNNINTHLWVAPAHTFDRITLKALRKTGIIKTICDGFSLFPFNKYGFLWIPQQHWGFVERKVGIWTTCLHPDNVTGNELKKMEEFLQIHHGEFICDLEDLTRAFQNRKKSIVDAFINFRYIMRIKYERKNI
ncbi:MAG: DUF2334 domain-containing protein [Chitinispirillia bacterium]|jgi:hypothetical protein